MSQAVAQDFFNRLDTQLDVINMRRIFLLMMRLHYSDAGNYGSYADDLSGLIWHERDDSPLLVDLLHVYNWDRPSPRPALYVGFDSYDFKSSGINSDSGENEDGSQEYKTKIVSTNLILRHVAAGADVCQLMAENSVSFLEGTRPFLLNRLRNSGLLKFDASKIGEVQLREKSPDRHFTVDAICPLAFNFVITTNIESHRIKKFALALRPKAM